MYHLTAPCIQRIPVEHPVPSECPPSVPVPGPHTHWPEARIRKEQWHPLPSRLRRGMEALTGIDLSPVKVFYNSAKPAQVQAYAYAQGDSIYLAPNQQHHLPHELGHIIQQAMGMVEPTMEIDGVAINDDPELEQHATDLGNLALNLY